MHACMQLLLPYLTHACTQKSEAAYHVWLASGANGKGGMVLMFGCFPWGGRRGY